MTTTVTKFCQCEFSLAQFALLLFMEALVNHETTSGLDYSAVHNL